MKRWCVVIKNRYNSMDRGTLVKWCETQKAAIDLAGEMGRIYKQACCGPNYYQAVQR